MKRVVNAEQKSTISCNRYVIAKWLQGQLANLCTFVHLCFIASAAVCFRTGAETLAPELDYVRDGTDHAVHAAEAALDKVVDPTTAKTT